MSSHSLLQNVYLFKTLSPTELDAVTEIAQNQMLGGGDAIFLRGEPARALHLIKSGTIQIQQSAKSGDTIPVATLAKWRLWTVKIVRPPRPLRKVVNLW